MGRVSIRDLRNHGGDVVDRAERGETITVTRAGKPVVELRALTRAPLSSEALLSRWRHLPALGLGAVRDDTDALIDPRL